MTGIKINVIGSLTDENAWKALQLPPAKRRQLLAGIAREIKRQSIRNIKAQKTPQGESWAPRKRGNDRKLLRRMQRKVGHTSNADQATVYFGGRVSYLQHEGYTKLMNAALMAKESGGTGASEKDPATRRQAKALRDENFMIRVKGKKKWRKPSLKWIETNLHVKQAGLILRSLRDEGQYDRKDSWVTTVPARRFLGVSEFQIDKFVNTIFDNTINSRR